MTEHDSNVAVAPARQIPLGDDMDNDPDSEKDSQAAAADLPPAAQEAQIAAADAIPDMERQSVMDDAEYVLREIGSGDALSGDAAKLANSSIAALRAAVVGYRSPAKPSVPEFYAVQAALTALMAQISPITIESLRDTQSVGLSAAARAHRFGLKSGSVPVSVADRFSNRLLLFTLAVLVLAVACAASIVPPEGGSGAGKASSPATHETDRKPAAKSPGGKPDKGATENTAPKPAPKPTPNPGARP
jgi:hypothetical protein